MKHPLSVPHAIQTATGVTPTPPVPKPAKVVTPPTVPAFSMEALVAAVAALPGATVLTVSKDLMAQAHLLVTPGIAGKPVTSNPPASVTHLKVRSDHRLSPGTWSVA